MSNLNISKIKKDLDLNIVKIFKINSLSKESEIVRNNLKHWLNEGERIVNLNDITLKNIILLETISCIRATLVSLSYLDKNNKELYKNTLAQISVISTLLKEKELMKINKINEILNS